MNMEKKTERKKSTGKIILLIAVLIVAALAMLSVYKLFMPQGEAGKKVITVTVVHADQSKKEFTFQTSEAYLGPVITDAGLVEGEDGQYGLFITSADGETADTSRQQWWCITREGESLSTSADQTPIKNGDHFELTLTEGY